MFYTHKSHEDSYVSKIPSKIPTSSILKIYSYAIWKTQVVYMFGVEERRGEDD